MKNINTPQEVLTAFDILKSYLLENFPDAKTAAGGSEVIKRCHYCGDSRDTSSRHLYIGINEHNLITFHCFKCSVGGAVTGAFFRDLDIFDTDLISTVLDANSLAIKSIPTSGNVRRKKKIYAMPRIRYTENDITLKKLAYINNRLELNLSLEDLHRLKVIPNILEYLNQNNIGYYSRHPDIMKELDIGFLGYLSCDNTHIILRRLVPKEKVHPNISERYVNYNIFPNNRDGLIYYIIPGNVNPLMPCHIYMAEGFFDIISVYYNMDVDHTNAIFASAGGKGNYASLLSYILLQIGVPYFGLDLHIFSDNDLTQRDIGNLKSMANNINIKLNIHFNRYPGEKDFGVPRSRILL